MTATYPATTAADLARAAELLDAFNREFDTPTPGPQVLAPRLERLVAGGSVVVLLVGPSKPAAVGVAVVTLRPNLWYDGPVGLLDELYVRPAHRNAGLGTVLLRAAEAAVAGRGGELLEVNVDGDDTDARRFYERHGYACRHPGQAEPELYYSREL